MNDDRQECVRRQSPPGTVPRRVRRDGDRDEVRTGQAVMRASGGKSCGSGSA